MTYHNLDAFLIRLEQSNQLIHFTQSINADEVAEVAAAHNQAVWFDSIAGSPYSLVTNLYGMEQRLAWALGLDDLSELEARTSEMVDFGMSMSTLLKRGSEFLSLSRSVMVSNAPVQTLCNTENINIYQLPRVKDRIFGAQIIIGNTTILGDVVVMSERTLDISDINRHEQKQPTAIVLGGDPVYQWSCGVPTPFELNPYRLAAWMRRRPVPFAHAHTQDIRVPADAEIVIEGWLDGTNLQVTAITHRAAPIIPTLLPQEFQQFNNSFRLFLMPLLRLLHREVVDLSFPLHGRYQDLIVISVNAPYEGGPQKVIFGLWGLFSTNRTLIVVDADVDVHNRTAVETALIEHVDWKCNLTVVKGMTAQGIGRKVGIDATRKPKVETSEQRDRQPSRLLTNVQWRELSDDILLVTEIGKEQINQLAAETHYGLLLLVSELQFASESIMTVVFTQIDWDKNLDISHNTVIVNITEETP